MSKFEKFTPRDWRQLAMKVEDLRDDLADREDPESSEPAEEVVMTSIGYVTVRLYDADDEAEVEVHGESLAESDWESGYEYVDTEFEIPPSRFAIGNPAGAVKDGKVQLRLTAQIGDFELKFECAVEYPGAVVLPYCIHARIESDDDNNERLMVLVWPRATVFPMRLYVYQMNGELEPIVESGKVATRTREEMALAAPRWESMHPEVLMTILAEYI